MIGLCHYFIDEPTAAEADSRYPTTITGFYTTVIRKLGTPGWVFRFTAGDRRGAKETLANLNWGSR